MKSIALVTAACLGSLSQLAPAASETQQLRSRCAEQERQIKELEKELDNLHALLEKKVNSGSKIAAKSPSTTATSSATSQYTVRKGDSLSSIARKHKVSLNSLLTANSGINPNRLQIGQKVSLPSSATSTTASSKSKQPVAATNTPTKATDRKSLSGSYVVKKGDTLYGIARKHGTSISALQASNGSLDARSLQVGQRINLSGSSQMSRQKTSSTNKPVATKKTTSQASAKKSTASKKPAVAKKSTSSQKSTTQAVKHAPTPAKVLTVTVNKQVTFGDFAKQHGSTIQQLNELNGLKLSKSTVLAKGSELYIPGKAH